MLWYIATPEGRGGGGGAVVHRPCARTRWWWATPVRADVGAYMRLAAAAAGTVIVDVILEPDLLCVCVSTSSIPYLFM